MTSSLRAEVSSQALSPGRPASPGAAADLVAVTRWRAREQAEREALIFLADGEEESERLGYAELDRRARALAARLGAEGIGSGPALLVLPSSVEYVVAFLGCLYAGVIAAPAYPPRFDRYDARLEAIAADAGPRLTLTTAALQPAVGRALQGTAGGRTLAVDEVGDALAAGWRPPAIVPGDVAFLQYTSGSTRSPRGVAVAHAHLLHNQRLLQRATGNTSRSVHVTWLPLHHDLGLVATLCQALYVGAPLVMMPTEAFVRRPRRWLAAIDRYRSATSLAPNFAFDLCARKVLPAERDLDLSSWTLALNGAEPVRPGTLERFIDAFAPCGFQRRAFYPAFGLAEATGFVTGGRRRDEPKVLWVEAAPIEAGEAVPADPGAVGARAVVGLGRAWLDGRILIVDPESREPKGEGRVGEIWVGGLSVAGGYWRRPDSSRETFEACLAAGDGPFLRTGDLGFVLDGELYFTSRLEDLIIIDGLNHAPHDIEETVETSHAALRPGFCASFGADIEDREQLVVVAEVLLPGDPPEEAALREVAASVRAAVARRHGLGVAEPVLLRPGTIPRTSSGKIQRHACRQAWIDGALDALWRDRRCGATGRPAG